KLAISAIETMDQVAEIHPGSLILVEILRNGKKLTVEVTIQEYPASN
ncbi:outer membrane-stress sensor serine endopeptidase DegS, partial [Sodalis-like symbiont of Bactericera trigonica]